MMLAPCSFTKASTTWTMRIFTFGGLSSFRGAERLKLLMLSLKTGRTRQRCRPCGPSISKGPGKLPYMLGGPTPPKAVKNMQIFGLKNMQCSTGMSQSHVIVTCDVTRLQQKIRPSPRVNSNAPKRYILIRVRHSQHLSSSCFSHPTTWNFDYYFGHRFLYLRVCER